MRLWLCLLFLSGCCSLPAKPNSADYHEAQKATASIYQAGRACSAARVAEGLLTAAHCVADPAQPLIALTPDGAAALTLSKIDYRRDLALLAPSTPADAAKLALAFPVLLQPCPTREEPPAPIIAYGFPGYLGLGFTEELGHTWGYFTEPETSTVLLVSRDLGYPGESGGPVLDEATGCLAALEHAYVEPNSGSNKTITLMVSAEEITAFLAAKGSS